MTKQFIKVTPKGAKAPIIMRAACMQFYVSQGAKIEEPTMEEIRKAFPCEFSNEKTSKAPESGAGKTEENSGKQDGDSNSDSKQDGKQDGKANEDKK